MIIVDKALESRHLEGNPIQVALVGAGYMGRGIALQIIAATPGMRLVAIGNRTRGAAERAYHSAGVSEVVNVTSVVELEDALARNRYVVTDNAMLLCHARGIDAIIEATGTIEFGAQVALAAIRSGKHIVLMNAELDATLGPILKAYADEQGVIFSNADGDQPGVLMNLYRFVKTIGFRPVLAGNIKGLHDPYRTPETQREFAARYGQKPRMVTSFADGSKISTEMAVVANGTGFRVGKRGMYGFYCDRLDHVLDLFPADQMIDGGLVDYVVGPEPAPGVFIIGYHEHTTQQQYLRYYKMGDGPFYLFYTPYHLCHFEVPITIARAVLFQDAALAPLGGPVVEVVTCAKRDVSAGELLDGIGGFTSYGLLENIETALHEKLLPLGISEGCRLVRNVSKDQVISYKDVDVPDGRLCDQLREEQLVRFGMDEVSVVPVIQSGVRP